MLLHSRNTLENLPPDRWEREAFDRFASVMTNRERRFPCTLGVAGLQADHLRYAFVDHPPSSEAAACAVAASLQSYLPSARQLGRYTSLVVFFNETRLLPLLDFERQFWYLLNRVHQLDAGPWPVGVARDPDEALWEFSFAQEAVFVVCNTPSHQRRHSRHSHHFMLTFQPRWVFDGLSGQRAAGGDATREQIRQRLTDYDELAPSPSLGHFGDPDNREWRQYFLGDDNASGALVCPFQHRGARHGASVWRTPLLDLHEVIEDLRPPTGSVEVQHDTPHRRHEWHTHACDETLHVLEGSIGFEIDTEVFDCAPGDRLLLPADTRHASTAGPLGCRYVIATRLVPPAAGDRLPATGGQP